MKVLILKPSSLGDVIHALPLLRLLKLHRPGAHVSWWLASELTPLLENDPDLAEIIPFDRRRWRSPVHWPELFAGILQMRRQRFDWVIDLQGLARSGTFAWLANGGLSIGLDTGREGAHGFYDLAVPRPSYGCHAVDWYLDVLRRLGVPTHGAFTWLPPRGQVAAKLRRKWSADGKRWLALCPGARWDNKRWPLEHFAELIKIISREQPQFHFAILGGADDFALGAALAQVDSGRVLNLAGKTSLPEMIEWVRLAELTVTNDTGPMHVAAALGKPVIAIFGPTDPRRTGPYGQVERALRVPLPCAPCLKGSCDFEKPLACLRGISPENVAAEIGRRLEAARICAC
ncbi:MAG: lipopolysaccharide heptosyltransferase II [Verrucomicrobia bacterium]|nr:lipopolysaccharide heptosyltransferase II [Verrucomicrobiota bacterium]